MLSTTPIFILSLAASAAAQTVLVYGSNALPSCASSCTLLQQAQSACVPPAAPVTNQVTYESCFCQSGYLSTLRTSTSGICDSVCDASDLTQIQTWYISNCQNNGANAAASLASSSSATAKSTTAAATGAASTSGSTSTGTPTSTGAKKTTWWSTHYKWVAMLIAIAIGLSIVAVIGVLLKRHYRRKLDTNTTPFNTGITTRHTQMSVAPSMSEAAAGLPGSVRTTPMSYAQYGYTGSDSRPASGVFLPRVREKDRASASVRAMTPDPGDDLTITRADMTMGSMEMGRYQPRAGSALRFSSHS